MLCPALQNIKLETVPKFPHLFQSIRFVFEDRAYALAPNLKPKATPVFAPNIHIGHEISLYATLEALRWKLSQKDEPSSIVPSEQISKIDKSQIAAGFFFRYAYQIPFTANFGFFLGSTIGITVPFSDTGQFHTGYGFFFPTILVGFTGSPTVNDRLALGFEYSASWYPQMYVKTNEGFKKELAPALDAWNFFLTNDYFLNENFSVSVGAGVRLINNACGLLFVCSTANYLNTLNLNDVSYYAQAGVIFAGIQ